MNSITQKLTSTDIPKGISPDIIVIGGGPVGLWTAIQTRLLTDKEIVVIEKYDDYKRNSIRLNIQASSLYGTPDDLKLKDLCNQWAKKKVVPILEMENDLLKRAHELGIQILRGKAANPKTLPQLFPSASVFIGADGARSEVRSELFQNRFSFNSNLQYLARIEYIAKTTYKDNSDSSFQSVKNLTESYSKQKFAEHIVSQTIHPLENGSSKVTLQIFIDQATYNQMTDATFKNPWGFKTDLKRIPSSLQNVLIKWWGANKVLHKEEISQETDNLGKITVLALNQYAVKDPVFIDENKKAWALVGDAAQVYPYFRSINNGFLLGTKLANAIHLGLQEKRDLFSELKSYSRYARFRSILEYFSAFFKNILLQISHFWLQISNKVPWQTIKLSTSQKNQIHIEGTSIYNRLSGDLVLSEKDPII